MLYKIKNGLNVCDQGMIIINRVEHFVLGGFVACDSSLNSRAWNITKKEKECLRCKDLRPVDFEPVQLKLF